MTGILLILSLAVAAQSQDSSIDENPVASEDTTAETQDPSASTDDDDATDGKQNPVAKSGTADTDFEPDEEISEDFPIPLPSDI